MLLYVYKVRFSVTPDLYGHAKTVVVVGALLIKRTVIRLDEDDAVRACPACTIMLDISNAHAHAQKLSST